MFRKKNEVDKTTQKNATVSVDSHDYQYIYTVHDKVAGRCVGTFAGSSDAVMLRVSLPSILMDFSFRDIEIYRVARIDFVTGLVEGLDRPKVIPLDTYLFPHSRLSPKGEDVSLQSLDNAMKELHHNMKKNLDEMIEKQMKENNKSEVVNE